MRNILLILFALFSITALPMMAQTNNEPQMKKEASKARVTILQGQDHLVLVTGRKANSYNPNIEIALDAKAWETLDNVLSGKQNTACKMKDVDGHNVEVAKANVNSKVGLMFTSGTKCVALTKEELDRLK